MQGYVKGKTRGCSHEHKSASSDENTKRKKKVRKVASRTSTHTNIGQRTWALDAPEGFSKPNVPCGTSGKCSRRCPLPTAYVFRSSVPLPKKLSSKCRPPALSTTTPHTVQVTAIKFHIRKTERRTGDLKVRDTHTPNGTQANKAAESTWHFWNVPSKYSPPASQRTPCEKKRQRQHNLPLEAAHFALVMRCREKEHKYMVPLDSVCLRNTEVNIWQHTR